MWRAFFLAIGIFLLILGAECLLIEKAVLAREVKAASEESGGLFAVAAATPRHKEITPPDWAPWSFMSAGAVVLLYSFTIPRRVGA